MEMWAIATFSLVAGVVDDLRSRKVHNGLVLSLLPAILIASLYFRGMDGTFAGVGALLLALVLTIPLYMLGAIGGGDVKLFAAFSLCIDPTSMFSTLIFSIIWGAVFSLTRATVQRELLSLVRSTYRIASRPRAQPQVIHKIPFTFAMLLGWFTQLTLLRAGGQL
jgi:prepilin peptidase CpaA